MAKLALKGGTPQRTKPYPWPIVGEKEKRAVLEVVESGVWGHAMVPECKVTEFENMFAKHYGVKYAISVHGGSVALEIALRSAGIGLGDEVLTTALTWVAPQLAPVIVGADPVFIDVDPETFCMDAEKIEAAITPKTKAIIPVHLGGNMCDMDRIMEIAAAHDLLVIEDCAQAHGSRYKGNLVGTMGHLACFSFEASKILTAGEGGMIITNDDEKGTFCYSYANAGWDYGNKNSPATGKLRWNLRMTEFQAALLSIQLKTMEKSRLKRVRNAEYLNDKISRIEGLNILPLNPNQNFYSYLFKYDSESFQNVPVDVFREALSAEGIPIFSSASHQLSYDPLLFHSPRRKYDDIHCPVAEKTRYKEAVGIRAAGVLMYGKADMDDIVNAIIKIKMNIAELV